MISYVQSEGNVTLQRFSWIIESFVDEALIEMADGTPDQVAAFFEELSRLIHWVATGELNGIQTDELTSGFAPLRMELESGHTQAEANAEEAQEALLEVEDAQPK